MLVLKEVLYVTHDNLFIHSLQENSIGIAGAQVLAEGLQHCTSLQDLK